MLAVLLLATVAHATTMIGTMTNDAGDVGILRVVAFHGGPPGDVAGGATARFHCRGPACLGRDGSISNECDHSGHCYFAFSWRKNTAGCEFVSNGPGCSAVATYACFQHSSENNPPPVVSTGFVSLLLTKCAR
jgi:hypothetical protein